VLLYHNCDLDVVIRQLLLCNGMLIGVANLKGGVGKSTVAVNLACELADRNRSALIVDADEQGTVAEWTRAGKLPVPCEYKPLRSDRDVQAWARAVLVLQADYIVIDCPPRLTFGTQAAVAIVDLVLVPVGASGADLAATNAALELVRTARRERNDRGPKCLLVPSRVDRRTMAGREIDGVLEQLGETVGPAISQRTSHVDSFSAGLWIGDYAPHSAAHEDIRALADRVIRFR
jgi:chromosome partitioning protein